MDLRLTEKEQLFRQQVRKFIDSALPPDWDGTDVDDSDEAWSFNLAFRHKLGERGWLAMSWPKEYGGQARPHMEQLILMEELAYHRAPQPDMGVTFVGPAFIIHGNKEQKERFLPRIARGEVTFCEGFSEPGAGSDLASLQTRAAVDGDEYVIDGQKTFTSRAHRADYCWLTARTDVEAPKHKGISVFVVNMKTPGITVRPMMTMVGIHLFNDVFFDSVRVPKECLVGEENRGWYQIVTTLDYERGVFGAGVAMAASSKRLLEDLIQLIKEACSNGRYPSPDPILRHRLAEMAIEIEVSRMLSYRISWMQSRGLVPNYEASVTKVFSSELSQRLAQTGLQILGLHGPLTRESKWALLKGRVLRSYLMSVGFTIGAGTSEIQRNIIAIRGLGLPR